MLNSHHNPLFAVYRAILVQLRRLGMRFGDFAWNHQRIAKCGVFAVVFGGLAILIGRELIAQPEPQTTPVPHVFLDESPNDQNVKQPFTETVSSDSKSLLSPRVSATTSLTSKSRPDTWRTAAKAEANQAAVAKQTNTRSMDSRRKAVMAYKAGDMIACRTALRTTSQQDNTLPPPDLLFVDLLLATKNFEAATSELERIKSQHSSHPAYHRIAGYVALAQQRTIVAEFSFRTAVDLIAKTQKEQAVLWTADGRKRCKGRCHLGLARLSASRKDWPTAEVEYRQAARLMPTKPSIGRHIAKALFEQKQFEEAKEHLDGMMSLNLEKTEAPHVTLARFAAASTNPQLAEEWFQRSISETPKLIQIRTLYADWLMDRGHMEQAETQLSAAEEINPDALLVHTSAGKLALHRQQLSEAEEQLRTAYSQQPDNFEVANLLTLVLLDQSDVTKQQQGFELAMTNIRSQPNNATAMATLGKALHITGRPRDAARILTGIAAGGQISSEAVFYLAQVKTSLGETDHSMELLKRALAAPGNFFSRERAQLMFDQLQSARKSS